jgi:FkbM family methyltransferase
VDLQSSTTQHRPEDDDTPILGAMHSKEDPSATVNRLRDFAVNLVVSCPSSFSRFLFKRFNRVVLWFLFHAYQGSLVIAPAGPRGNRFRMWLDPQSYSDFICGIYEPGCTKLLRRFIREGSFGLDIGANLGYFTILMSRLAGESGNILAFEAMPDTLEVLRQNVRLNNLRNVGVVAAAVCDRTGTVELLSRASQHFTKTASVIGYRLDGPVHRTVVSALRLDEYFVSTDHMPDVIKIDVEGGELAVLNGATNLLKRARPTLIIEVHDWGSPASREVLRFFSEHEYSLEIVEVRMPEALCVAQPIN